MTVALYVLGVLLVGLGIGLSIALHEIGHLIPAKRFGVRVTQYMVGFGPTIWSRRRGETEYGIKAIPLGGYIRMIGMFPPRAGDAEGTVRASSTGRFSQLVDEARDTSMEEVRPGDENRVFYKLSTGRKIVTMLGGPVMNFVIAAVLLTLVVMVRGIPTLADGATVASVSQCVVPATDAAQTTSCEGRPQTPAAAAGLQPGDQLLSVDGTQITSTADVGRLVRPRVGQPTSIVVLRDGAEITLTATPIENTLPVYDEQGQAVLNADGTPQTQTAGFLGVTSAPIVENVPQPLSAVPGVVGQQVWLTGGALFRIPEKMIGVYQAAFSDAPRELDSPMSVVGVGRVAGEATAGRLDALVGDSVADKFWFLMTLLASLNIMLFVFNLVPLLPLDGGHVAGAIWEWVKRGAAKMTGRPDPGYVDVAKALPIAYGVSSLLLVMTVLLVYADLVNPVKLG
ncbi:MAG: site-2 protease family protein [Phycicoccus sp.]|nr:site-2 protease family protein [Phycicoccus sp.]